MGFNKQYVSYVENHLPVTIIVIDLTVNNLIHAEATYSSNDWLK